MKQQNSLMDIISAFNNNIVKNTEIIEYINKRNIFDLIRKSRNEMTHSSFLMEIIAGKFFSNHQESSLMHFLDILVQRAKEQDVHIDKKLQDAIITRMLPIESIEDKKVEYQLGQYSNKKGTTADDSKDRLDIYISVRLCKDENVGVSKEDTKQKVDTLEIFVENKVESSEGDNQTQRYFETCNISRKGKSEFKLFVYLTPISNKELDDYANVKNKPQARTGNGNMAYIYISYQDVLDHVIEPLLYDSNLNEIDKTLLKEYINCLELPAKPEDVDTVDHIGSIMATSNYERNLVRDFINDPINRQVFEIVVNSLLNDSLYTYKDKKWLSWHEAISLAVNDAKANPLQMLKKIKAKGVSYDYLVASFDGKSSISTSLYEYNEKAYSSICEALKDAIADFINRNTGIRPEDVIKKFEKVINGKNKLLINEEREGYVACDISGIFIRKIGYTDECLDIKCDSDNKEKKINSILYPYDSSKGIKRISENCFSELLKNETKCSLFTDGKVNDEYVKIGDTIFYYRNIDSAIKELSSDFGISKSDNIKNTIKDFAKTHQSLIIAVYNVLLDFNSSDKEYGIDLSQSNLNKLIKATNA